jgi:predicted DNA binding CopG/RHH family protein
MKSKSTKPLDSEEADLALALEKREIKSLKKPSAKRQSSLKKSVKKFLNSESKMNIRISPEDLEAIKQRASREGLKYQTFVKSVLHKFVTG